MTGHGGRSGIWQDQEKGFYGLQTLQGRKPALMASSRVENIFEQALHLKYLHENLWKTFEVTFPLYSPEAAASSFVGA